MTDQPTNKKEFCLEDLKTRILTLALRPGEELDELSVAREYGLSRTPMREIYQVLNGAGFISLQHNRGARVASLEISAARFLFQTAPTVLANTARLACEHHTPSQLAQAEALQISFNDAIDQAETEAAVLLDYQFHMLIGEMSGCFYLMPAVQRIVMDQARLSRAFFRPEKKREKKQVKKAALQHDLILEAIAAGNAERAANQSLHHWEVVRARMDAFFQPDPLPVSAELMEN